VWLTTPILLHIRGYVYTSRKTAGRFAEGAIRFSKAVGTKSRRPQFPRNHDHKSSKKACSYKILTPTVPSRKLTRQTKLFVGMSTSLLPPFPSLPCPLFTTIFPQTTFQLFRFDIQSVRGIPLSRTPGAFPSTVRYSKLASVLAVLAMFSSVAFGCNYNSVSYFITPEQASRTSS
jgi:hypothetical protein